MLYKSVRADPLHRDLDQFTDLLVEPGEHVDRVMEIEVKRAAATRA